MQPERETSSPASSASHPSQAPLHVALDPPSMLTYEGSANQPSSAKRQKRAQATAACQRCRDLKVKCDEHRPQCGHCRQRNFNCVWTVREHESRSQASKRRIDEAERSLVGYRQLYERLASCDYDSALELLLRLRTGHSVNHLLEYRGKAPAYSAQQVQHLDTSSERQRRQELVVTLTRSTAPLHDIIVFAATVLESQGLMALPALESYHPFKRRLITLDALAGVFGMSSLTLASNNLLAGNQPRLPTEEDLYEPDVPHEAPRHWVPASPWTTLTTNDDAVSELVSVALTWLNSFWRLLEEDLFLRAMRSRAMDESEYCSPFLVAALLAIGAQYSEIDEAFTTPGHLITRGERFHQEAVRLRSLESNHPCISNVQALLILSFDATLRGKDALGYALVTEAVNMNRLLPLPKIVAGFDLATKQYARARRCLAAAVVHLSITITVGMLRPFDQSSATLEDRFSLEGILPDRSVIWSAYPYKHEPVAFHANLLLQERAKLADLTWELGSTLFRAKHDQSCSAFRMALDTLAHKFLDWYSALPEKLHKTRDSPAPLFELHAYYNCMMMTLNKYGLDLLERAPDQTMDPMTFRAVCAVYRQRKLDYAQRHAALLVEYREIYGYSIALSMIYHGAALNLFIFLQEMQARDQDRDLHGHPASHQSSHDLDSAFEESFRCLLACGVQTMLPRGIARMVYLTAVQQGVRIPDRVAQMLALVADTGWHPKDVNLLEGSYPNWAIDTALSDGSGVEVSRMKSLLLSWERMNLGEAGVRAGS